MRSPRFFKILQVGWRHFQQQYVVGLNQYRGVFDPRDPQAQGLFICEFKDILYWLKLYEEPEFICDVELLPESRLVQFARKWKTDQFILSNPRAVPDFLRANFNVFEILRADPYNLRFLDTENRVVQLYALDLNPRVLPYVKNPHYLMVADAVKECGLLLQYYPKAGPEICTPAVKQNPFAICISERQPPESCLEAVQRNGLTLQCIRAQTHDLCLAAVMQNGYALRYVKEQTLQLCRAAVYQNRAALQFCWPEFRAQIESERRRRLVLQ